MEAKKLKITEEEYLDSQLAGECKSEFHFGEILSMAGASENHVLVVTNVLSELRNCLKGKNCRVYSSDRLVYTPECENYYYPDIFIVCGDNKTHKRSERVDAIINPTVIIEVLSDSTREYEIEKFRCYQTMQSLRQYVTIEPGSIRIDSFQRQDGKSWLMRLFDKNDTTVQIADCEIPIDEIYDKVAIETP